MDLQELTLRFIKLHLKEHQSQLLQVPKRILMELFKAIGTLKETEDCQSRFQDIEAVKNALEILYQVLKTRGKLDDDFEDYLGYCFDKSILEFVVSQNMDKRVLQTMEALHAVDLSKCLIGHKTDLGKRISAFAPRPLLLEEHNKVRLRKRSKSKGSKINTKNPIMEINGLDIQKIAIWKSGDKVRGLKVMTRDGKERASNLYDNAHDDWLAIPKGQWLSYGKVSISPGQDYISDLELFTSCQGDRPTIQEKTKYVIIMAGADIPLTRIQAQVNLEEDGRPLLTGIKFFFEYHEPRQEYLCSKLGFDLEKCIHADTDINVRRRMHEFHRKLRDLEQEARELYIRDTCDETRPGCHSRLPMFNPFDANDVRSSKKIN